jgi:SAM-dependent methyltransferase
MIERLVQHGFQTEGLDISAEMISLARQRHPGLTFHQADISRWSFPHPYDLIVAWDSTWHLPLPLQVPVLETICGNLTAGGVHLFTTIGFDEPGDHGDSGYLGVPLAYSTLGIPRLLELLAKFNCVCRHLEFDQFPEKHLFVIAQKL